MPPQASRLTRKSSYELGSTRPSVTGRPHSSSRPQRKYQRRSLEESSRHHLWFALVRLQGCLCDSPVHCSVEQYVVSVGHSVSPCTFQRNRFSNASPRTANIDCVITSNYIASGSRALPASMPSSAPSTFPTSPPPVPATTPKSKPKAKPTREQVLTEINTALRDAEQRRLKRSEQERQMHDAMLTTLQSSARGLCAES